MLQLEKNLYEIQHHISEFSNLIRKVVNPLSGFKAMISGYNANREYLNTNFSFNNNCKLEIKFEYDNDNLADISLLGYVQEDENGNPINSLKVGFTNGITIIYGNTTVSGIDGVDLRTPGIKILTIDANNVYLQEGENASPNLIYTFEPQEFTTGNIFLFSENFNDSPRKFSNIKLYNFKIYDLMSNGFYDVINDYIIIRKWNDEIKEYEFCLYDRANKILKEDVIMVDGESTGAIIKNVKYENVGSNEYGFVRLNENYWESTNKGVNSTYSLVKVTFDVIKSGTNVPIKYISYGESSYDYGIFSALDRTLTDSSTADTSNVKLSAKGYSSPDEKDFVYSNVSAGTHFIYVKYVKDGSSHTGNDSLRFRVVEEDEDKFYQQPCAVDITVTKPAGTYQFVKQSDGYYKSNNNGVNNSYALAKISFKVLYGRPTLTISYRCYAESGYDMGLFSNLDTTLEASNSVDGSYKLKCANSSSYSTLTYTNITPGTHYIYAKYRKDVSTSSNDDALRFKIVSIE